MRWFDRTAGLLDRAVLGTRGLRGAPDDRIEAMHVEERLARLAVLRDRYADPALLLPGAFLPHGGSIDPLGTPFSGGVDLSWPSGYRPWNADVGDAYLAKDPANATAHARLYTGERPRPVVVAIHGYGAGRAGLEGLVWPLRAWRRAGLDVVLPNLPFHGRRSSRFGAPPFPAADPRYTHEGFRQSVHDLGALVGCLRARGHPRVALVGMSLGGYAAALLATVLDDIDALGLVVPLACIPTLAWSQGRLGEGPLADRVRDALRDVYRPSSPLSRPPRVRPDRVRILAARGDLVTGLPHAELLAAHFGAEPILCPGSHVVQAGIRWSALTELLR